MKENYSREKVYIDALLSMKFQFYRVIGVFLIAPFGILYLYFIALKAMDFKLTFLIIGLTLMCSIVLFFLVMIFLRFRNHLPFKIATNDAGLYYFGLFKKVHAYWDEILSMTVSSFMGRESIKLETKKDTIYFPITMKLRDDFYFKLSVLNDKWIDAQGIEKPMTPENCPLYIEIQERLKRRG